MQLLNPVIADDSLLVIAESFCHFMFQFPPWFQHPVDFLLSSFKHSRFDASAWNALRIRHRTPCVARHNEFVLKIHYLEGARLVAARLRQTFRTTVYDFNSPVNCFSVRWELTRRLPGRRIPQ